MPSDIHRTPDEIIRELNGLSREAFRLDAILQHMPYPLLVVTVDGRPVFVNKALQQEMRIESLDHFLDHFNIFAETAHAEHNLRDHFRKVFAGETLHIPEARVERSKLTESLNAPPDTSIAYYEITAFPITGDDGGVHQAAAIFKDITGQKKAELALRESEQMFRSLAEKSPNMIFINSGGKVVYTNKVCEEMMGYCREEFLAPGFDFMTLIAPEHRQLIRDNLARHFRGEEIEPYEYTLMAKNGARIDVIITTKLIDFHGEKAILGIVTDITGRKKAEAEREKMEAQFRQAQKMEAIGRLAGGVAHDFNNLLTAINGYSDIVLKQMKEGDPLYDDIIEIRKAGERASALTRQLLTFSRREPYEPTVIDLNALIHDVEKMLKPIIGEDIELTLDLSVDLARVKADSGQMEQVILNLAVNARDAMPRGGRLSIATRNVNIDTYHAHVFSRARPGNFVCMSVRDTGTGISADVRPHIFEPFFTTKEEGKGTGLGLSVVYGIVNQHGGWIDLYSEVGKGTEFRVYLPIFSIVPAAAEKPRRHPLEKLKGNGEKILLVEDADSVRLFGHRILSANGYSVHAAKNAQEAMDIFGKENGRFDMLFTDIVLPDIAGPELYNRLLESNPGLKAILTSGYTEERSDVPIRGDSSYTFLQKPYLAEDLLRTIKQLISSTA